MIAYLKFCFLTILSETLIGVGKGVHSMGLAISVARSRLADETDKGLTKGQAVYTDTWKN